MKESWRTVSGYQGRYKISSLGRVKSLGRQRVQRGGRHVAWTAARILKPDVSDAGYMRVVLYDKDGIPKRRPVHQLVLEAFVGACPLGMEVRHFPDRTPSNNCLDNLSWGTRIENRNDRKLQGTEVDQRGEKNYGAKLREEDVLKIREIYAAGLHSMRGIALLYCINVGSVFNIVHRKTWGHV